MTQATILVVGGESIIVQDFESGLESMGYDVPVVAASGEEALRQAGEVRPDLALIDINLTGEMDGIETAARLRELFGVPPVYLAAHGDQETFDRARITVSTAGLVLFMSPAAEELTGWRREAALGEDITAILEIPE